MEEKSYRKVYYVDKDELEQNILRQLAAVKLVDETEDNQNTKKGRKLHNHIAEGEINPRLKVFRKK